MARAQSAQPVTGTLPIHRGYGDWHSSHIGGGGYLQQVVIAPSDPKRLYLSVDVGGLFRSDDGGSTWRMLHGNLPARAGNYSVAGISVDPANADRVLIATGSVWTKPEGIYLTEDGGQTWQPTQRDIHFAGDGQQRAVGSILLRSAVNAKQVFAGSSQDGLFRSEDGGSSWTNLGIKNTVICAIAIDSDRPERVMVVAHPIAKSEDESLIRKSKDAAGFYVSEDSGDHFKRVSVETPRQIVQDPLTRNRWYGTFEREQIKFSSDGGATWNALNAGLPLFDDSYRSPGRFYALAAGPDFLVTASCDGTFYRMPANGSSWTRVDRESVDEGNWFARIDGPTGHQHFGAALGHILIDPRSPDHWFFTDWYALYQSADAGRHWRLTIDGIEVTVVHCVRGVPGNPSLVHMGMADNGYFRSKDGAATFDYVKAGISNNVKDIAIAPDNVRRLYAVAPKTHLWQANQVFISDDEGLRWRRSQMIGLPDMEKARCNTIVAMPGNADEVLLAVSGDVGASVGGPYRSSDGGQTWRWIGEGLPAGKAYFQDSIWVIGRELASDVKGHLIAVSRNLAQVFRADGAGANWQPVEFSSPFKPNDTVASPTTANRFFIADTQRGVWTTTDAGKTWTNLFPRPAHHLAIDPSDDRNIAASTDDGIVLSRDGGSTWIDLDKNLPYRVARLPLTFAGDRLVVGTGGNGVFWIDLKAAAATTQSSGK